MASPHDLIVVGAGPAGASAARRAAEIGLSVFLLERSIFPRSKPCASGLTPRALALLGPDADGAVHVRTNVIEIAFGGGAEVAWTAGETVLATTTRRELDALLVERARAAGAGIEHGCPVDAMELGADGVRVGSGGRSWLARYVVGADGVRSDVRGMAGLSAVPVSGAIYVRAFPPERDALGAFVDRVRFDLSATRRGYGWVFPKRDHLNVGVYAQRGLTPGLSQALDAFLRSRGLGSWRLEGPFASPVPAGVAADAAAGRVLLAGDAAGFADPVTGEGISHAIASGRAAAESVADSLASGGSAARIYEARVAREIVPALHALRRRGNLAYSIGPRAAGFLLRLPVVRSNIARLKPAGLKLVAGR